jgi:hypothetical protein
MGQSNTFDNVDITCTKTQGLAFLATLHLLPFNDRIDQNTSPVTLITIHLFPIMLSALVVVLLSSLLCYFWGRRKVGHSLPPGPRPLPICGNIMHLPPQGTPEYQHWIKFKDLYGPISSVTVLGTTMVILQCNRAVQDILGKMSTRTSGRPNFYFANEMCGFGGLTPNLGYTSTHRLHRKFMHMQMGTKTLVERFHDIQDLESRRFLLRVLDNPTNLIAHIKT